jgi:RND family efflux transporter MFP subunit
VKKISVDYGDRVEQGQELATLEVPELDDELGRSVASTRGAEEDISAAQEELNRALSVHNVTHLVYTRLAAVLDTRPGLVAQQDVDAALGKDQEAEAKIAADKAATAAAQQHLEVAKANEQEVRTMLAYTKITAPFRGVITKRYADTGAMIQQGTASHTQAMPLVRLAQNDVLRLVIPVPESDVPRIKLGEPIEVTVPALNRSFRGHVARFSDQLDLETRTMPTEVDVPNPDLILVPGMYAFARLALDKKSNVLAVPMQAISRGEGKTTVFRVSRDGKMEECAVHLGLETPNEVEVISGLQENDLVVVGDRSALKPGEEVNPKIVAETSLKGGR